MPDEMNNRSKTGVVVSTFSAADVVRLTVVVYSRRQAGIQIEPADLGKSPSYLPALFLG
jgi:hypothetical protein